MDALNDVLSALKPYLPASEGFLPYYMFTVRAPIPPPGLAGAPLLT